MKRVLWIVAILAVVGTSAMVSLRAQEGPENTLDRARINRLVRDLGSENPQIRDEATRELRHTGAPALPALREAAKSSDAEVSYRAQRLIEQIEQGGREPEVAEEEGNERATRPQRRRAPTRMGSNFALSFNGNGSFSLRRDADGHIELRVKEKDKDGAEVETLYEADSVEQFVEKYPDVAKKYGIQRNRTGFITIPDLGNPRLGKEQEEILKGFQEDLMKEMQEVLKQSRRSLEEMFKGFSNRGGSRRGFPFPDDFDKLFEEDVDPFRLDEEMERKLDEELGRERPDEGGDRLDRGGSRPEPNPDETFAPWQERTGRTRMNDGLKVEYLSPALRAQLGIDGTEGVLVSEVEAGGPGERAGLRKYDVILRVNDQPVRASLEFRRILKDAIGSGHVLLDVVRKGEAITLDLDRRAIEAFRK